MQLEASAGPGARTGDERLSPTRISWWELLAGPEKMDWLFAYG